MTEAAEKPTIYEVFAEVKRQVRAVGKDSKNDQQHFNFRGIDAVVNAAAPALDKHGVITAPVLQKIEYTTVEVGQKRTPMAHVRVEVAYRFIGPAGDFFEAVVPGEAMDSGDKATAKAMSVAYRIALLQGLNLPTSDTDPDSQTYERSPQRSAGEAFDNATPARPGNGNGNGHVSRPAAQPAAAADAPVDDEAQELANEAYQARTVRGLSDLHKKAHDAGKLNAIIANPATGGRGTFGAYVNWRRKQVTAELNALDNLQKAGKAAGLEGDVLDERVKELTGVSIEAATVAQMEAATASLATAGAPA